MLRGEKVTFKLGKRSVQGKKKFLKENSIFFTLTNCRRSNKAYLVVRYLGLSIVYKVKVKLRRLVMIEDLQAQIPSDFKNWW